MKPEAISDKVHRANAEAHDYYAEFHDLNVPYIRRRKTRKYYWQLITEAIASHGGTIAGANVLELGCGTGTFTELVLASGAVSYCGVDLSPKMIERARRKVRDQRAVYVLSSLEDFSPCNQGKFDVIISSSFLHHLVDIHEGVSLIEKLLRRNGVYVAIHEVSSNRSPSRLELIDEALQYIFGYAGSRYWPAKERIKQICHRLPVVNRLFDLSLRFRPIASAPAQPMVPGERAIDLVDYQLNQPFSIRAVLGNRGDVIPYSYLAYPELFVFGRPLNHDLFVLTKRNA